MKNKLQNQVSDMIGFAKCRIANIAFANDTMQEDLARINEMALKELTLNDIFCFEFELSNTNVDAYYTRMSHGSLQNYADKINTFGVPLMGLHDDETFPIGRMYKAEITQDDQGVEHLMVRAYIARGDQNNTIPSDAVISKIETGIQKDVSIGFLPGSYTCSICGGPMVPGWSARAEGLKCDHVCGVVYNDNQLCYAWVEDGIILEGSLVYTGATPGAIIEKALNMLKTNKLDATQVNSINKALHTKLTLNDIKGDNEMKAKEFLIKFAENGVSEELKNSLTEQSNALKDEDGVEMAINILSNSLKTLESEKNALVEKAQLGDEYRTDLIAKTLENGVRANGNSFNKELNERLLNASSIADIKLMNGQYEEIVKNNFDADKNGKKLTNGDAQDLDTEAPKTDDANGSTVVTANDESEIIFASEHK